MSLIPIFCSEVSVCYSPDDGLRFVCPEKIVFLFKEHFTTDGYSCDTSIIKHLGANDILHEIIIEFSVIGTNFDGLRNSVIKLLERIGAVIDEESSIEPDAGAQNSTFHITNIPIAKLPVSALDLVMEKI